MFMLKRRHEAPYILSPQIYFRSADLSQPLTCSQHKGYAKGLVVLKNCYEISTVCVLDLVEQFM
jgi:hypothetical protein